MFKTDYPFGHILYTYVFTNKLSTKPNQFTLNPLNLYSVVEQFKHSTTN